MEIENQMETRYGSSSSKVNKAVPKRNQTDDNDENTSNPSNPSKSSNLISSSNSSGSSDSTEELGSEQRPISVQTELEVGTGFIIANRFYQNSKNRNRL